VAEWLKRQKNNMTIASFEPDVVCLSYPVSVTLCSVSVIPFQHSSCSICMSFVRLGHHNG